MANSFTQIKQPSLANWKNELGKDDQPIELRAESLYQDLDQHFSVDVQCWIAACAVYPELHWDLTIKLGEALSNGESLISHHNLVQLAKIDWFRKGFIPDHIRERLLEHPNFTNEVEAQVRTTLVKVLEENIPPNKESYAFEEHQLHLAINKLLLNKMAGDKQKWLEVYRQQNSKGVEEDVVSLKELDKKYSSALAFVLPEKYLDFFFVRGRSILGTKNWVTHTLTFVLLAILFFLPRIWNNPGYDSPAYIGESAFDLRDGMDSVRYLTNYLAYYLDSTDYSRLDSISGRFLYPEAILTDHFANTSDNANRNPDSTQALAYNALFENYLKPYTEKLYNVQLRSYQDTLYQQCNLMFEKAVNRFSFWRTESLEFNQSGQLVSNVGFWNGSDQRQFSLDSMELVNLKDLIIDFYQVSALANYYEGRMAVAMERAADSYRWHLEQLDSLNKANFQASETQKAFYELALDIPYFNRKIPNIFYFLSFDFVDQPQEGRIRINKDGLYGFLDSLGKVVVEPQFRYVESYYQGRALATFESQQCYINLNGEVIPGECFRELIPRQGPDGHWGFTNERNVFMIPTVYLQADSFFQDLALVQDTASERYGYIDRLGQNQISFEYQEAGSFSQGLANVNKDGIWGYINLRGEIVIDFQYDFAEPFLDSARVIKNGNTYYINNLGECISSCPDRDGDGVIDERDQCPDEPAPGTENGCLPIDTDGDGLTDTEDDCPKVSGPAVLKGCPDRDGDGVPDKEDRCPDELGTIALNGCPILDRDNDGVPDEEDDCPNEAGQPENKGCPITGDRDKDGIDDLQDKCPNDPGDAINSGCPDSDNDGIIDQIGRLSAGAR